jgi:hypothetical protein
MFHLRVCWFTDLYFCLNLDTLAAHQLILIYMKLKNDKSNLKYPSSKANTLVVLTRPKSGL